MCPRCNEAFTGSISPLGEFVKFETYFDVQPSLFHVPEGPISPSSSAFIDEILLDENSQISKDESDEDWLSDSFLSNNVRPTNLSYLCEVDGCRKSFTSNRKSDYDRHQISHQQSRDFLCSYPRCTASFKLSGDLKKHLVVHRVARPFVCEICGASFKLKGNCARHKRLHQNQDRKRNFPCKECSRSFFWRGDLTRHMRVHREREFKCDFGKCCKTFVQKAHLENHQKRVHAAMSVPSPPSHSSPSPLSPHTSPIGRRTSEEDKRILSSAFKEQENPTDEDLERLNRELGEKWDIGRIRKWFKNKRDYIKRSHCK